MSGIKFQHITDEMRIGKKYDDIKTTIDERHEKTKQKLYELQYVYDIDYTIGEPYFIDRNKQAKEKGYFETEGPRNQYRYNVYIYKHKNNRKITRDNIYKAMNNIYITSYDKI